MIYTEDTINSYIKSRIYKLFATMPETRPHESVLSVLSTLRDIMDKDIENVIKKTEMNDIEQKIQDTVKSIIQYVKKTFIQTEKKHIESEIMTCMQSITKAHLKQIQTPHDALETQQHLEKMHQRFKKEYQTMKPIAQTITPVSEQDKARASIASGIIYSNYMKTVLATTFVKDKEPIKFNSDLYKSFCPPELEDITLNMARALIHTTHPHLI